MYRVAACDAYGCSLGDIRLQPDLPHGPHALDAAGLGEALGGAAHLVSVRVRVRVRVGVRARVRARAGARVGSRRTEAEAKAALG